MIETVGVGMGPERARRFAEVLLEQNSDETEFEAALRSEQDATAVARAICDLGHLAEVVNHSKTILVRYRN